MPNRKPLADLPQDIVEKLHTLKAQEDTQPLYDYVAHLASVQWPLRTIAQALGVSRTSALNYSRKGTPDDTQPPPEAPPTDTYGSGVRSKKIVFDVPPAQVPHLQELHELAKKKTRWTNANSPEAKAAVELNELLKTYRRRRIPISRLANHLSVSRRAITQRLEKIDV